MKIAIIGAGNVGQALGSSFTRAGHDVTLTSSNPEHAQTAAAAIGAHSVGRSAEAVAAADLVILAVPATAHEAVATDIANAAAGKVVVDVSNRPTPNKAGAGTSIAEELQEQLPNSQVVKAFNTLFATRQANPVVGGIAADGYVAGDDAEAKRIVLEAIESVGLTPVDAGSLAAARTLEGMAWLNISRNMAGGTWQDAWVLVGPDASGDERN